MSHHKRMHGTRKHTRQEVNWIRLGLSIRNISVTRPTMIMVRSLPLANTNGGVIAIVTSRGHRWDAKWATAPPLISDYSEPTCQFSWWKWSWQASGLPWMKNTLNWDRCISKLVRVSLLVKCGHMWAFFGITNFPTWSTNLQAPWANKQTALSSIKEWQLAIETNLIKWTTRAQNLTTHLNYWWLYEPASVHGSQLASLFNFNSNETKLKRLD